MQTGNNNHPHPKNNTRQENNIDEIDIRELLMKMLRKWYVFVAAFIVCVSLAVLYIIITPSEYSTTSSMLVRSDNTMGFLSSSLSGPASSLLDQAKAVDDEMEIMRSKTILGEMIDRLDLHTDIFYKKQFGVYRELYHNSPLQIIHPEGYLSSMRGVLEIKAAKKKKGGWKFEFKHTYLSEETEYECETDNLSSPVETPWGKFAFVEHPEYIDPDYQNYKLKFITRTRKSNIERYAELITVALTNKKTNVMTISMTGENAAKSEAIINTMVELYELDALKDKNETAVKMTDFITRRLVLLEEELSVVEQKVEEYRTKNNLADLSAQSKAVIESVSDYDKQVTLIDLQYTLVSDIENYVINSKEGDLLPSNTGVEDQTLANLIVSYNNQVLEYQRITRSTNESNPYVSQLKTKIELTRKNIIQTIVNVKKGLALQKQDLQGKNREIEVKISSVPKIEREYVEIAREQEVKRALYVFLLQKREEAQLSLASATNSTKVIDEAYTAEKPVAPRKKLILLAAGMLGLLFGCGYLYIFELINNKVTDKKMLRQLTSLPVIGMIPQAKTNGEHVVVKHGQISSEAEAFKLVRANIKFLFKKPEDNVLMITSSISGEGKSFFAVNLAASLALLNKKVALIGLDIRKPMLKKYMEVKGRYGVVDYLVDPSMTPQDICEKYKDIADLDIYISGTIPPDPTELLTHPRLKELMSWLRGNYDYVIIDSAPVSLVADSLIIDPLADAVIYVSRCGVTPKEYIYNLNELVNDGRLNNVSIVLNGVKKSNLYGYGYGYYYTNPSGKHSKK